MAINVKCRCGERLTATNLQAGETMTCPACGQTVEVPDYDRGPVQTSGWATAALVCGLLAFCIPIAGLLALVFGIIALMRIGASQGQLTGKGLAIGGIVTGLLGMLIFLPLTFFAVQRVRAAANGMVNASNLRQMGIAMHNYHNDHARLPPAAITSPNGEPLLSWRVAMLKFGDAQMQSLYRQFRLDEPWDSPHNHKLLEQMPKLYATPHRLAPPGMTYYQAFVGPNSCFEPGKAITLGQLTVQDGTANTILLAEAEEAVPWTKPQDMKFDPQGPLPSLSLGAGGRPEGYVLLFADCSVKTARKHLSSEDLRSLIDRRDGRTITPGVLD